MGGTFSRHPQPRAAGPHYRHENLPHLSPWVEVGKLEFSASITYDNKSVYVWLRQKGVILTLAGRDSPLKKPESSQRTQQPALGDRS